MTLKVTLAALDAAIIGEVVEEGRWSLHLHFGKGDGARDAMRSVADAIRSGKLVMPSSASTTSLASISHRRRPMSEPVEVTQADRDAAAEVTVLSELRDLIRSGKCDDWLAVQAFARHRLATRPALDVDGLVEKVARAIYKADTLDQNENTRPPLNLAGVDLDKWFDENAAMPLSGPGFVRRYRALALAAIKDATDGTA